jgi:hypothetical protein
MASSDSSVPAISPSDLKLPYFSPFIFFGNLFVRDLDDGHSYCDKAVHNIIDQYADNLAYDKLPSFT